MKIAVAGSKAFGASVVELVLARGYELTGVSVPDETAIADGDPTFVMATDKGIPCHVGIPSTLMSEADVLITAQYEKRVPLAVIGQTRVAFGYHPSLLPLHRGRFAIQAAIDAGDRVTGGTIYRLTEELDGGPIALQRHVVIRSGESAKAIWKRILFPLGIDLVDEALRRLSESRLHFFSQSKIEHQYVRDTLF